MEYEDMKDMKDKFLRWFTYKLLFYRLVKNSSPNCCGALYKDESGKEKIEFDVRIK